MTIDEICRKYEIENYTINPDGSIDVYGDVDFSDIDLYQIPLRFNKVYGHFFCIGSELTTLMGCPKWIEGCFDCSQNNLTSLEFGPEYVGSNFYCKENQLSSLEFSPKWIEGNFDCIFNLIYDIKNYPENLNGRFFCVGNPIGTIFDDVDQFFLHAFNFYRVIKDDTVNLKRLRYVMDLYDQPIDLSRIEIYYRIV